LELACSPFVSAAIIKLHLTTFLNNVYKTEANIKKLIEKLKEAFYVDNCVTSVDSENKLKTFVSDTTACMSTGGFELCRWESSEDSIKDKTTLVLGVLWNKRKDTISVNPAVLNMDNSDSP